MKSVSVGLQFVVLLLLIYFIYNSINLVYTIKKQKKEDSELKSLMSKTGTIILIVLTIIMIIGIIGVIIFEAINIMSAGILDANYWPLDIMAVVMIGYYFLFLSQTFFVGKKKAIIGRIAFDKRKMKRAAIKGRKFSFAYAQSTFSTSILLVDEEALIKEIRKMG